MRLKYEPIGDELSIQAAAVQAAFALDSSASIAEQQRDHAGLLAVGKAWMKLADFLAALRDADAKYQSAEQEKPPFGFHQQTVDLTDGVTFDLKDNEEEVEDVRDDTEEPDEG